MLIEGLETTEEQMDALAGGSIEEQVASLTLTLASDPQAAVLELYEVWRAGDPTGLEQILEQTVAVAGTSFYDRLLIERNRAWVVKLERMLEEEIPTFAVVGAAHLVGSESVQSLLSERGFSVRRVFEAGEL
jgi:uncharacterized protein YbaP (TraB family)